MISTATFWRAAGWRALYTLLAAALPFVVPLLADPSARAALEALAGVGFAVVLSLVTSLANLPELGAGRPPWLAVVDRVARTFFQVLLAALGTAAGFGDVDIRAILGQAAGAAAVTLIRSVIAALPEEATTSPDGAQVITTAPNSAPALAEGDRVITPGGAHGVITSLSSGDGGYTAAVRPDDARQATWWGPVRELEREA
ncbi:holin [Puerhibacterium puerhi]|uniref:holin n=1 Tax=Puerhibacterium puerhi TaxID=2692623 RepID=UPI00135AA84E|nr:holin [Puerhibacterium puerhi]